MPSNGIVTPFHIIPLPLLAAELIYDDDDDDNSFAFPPNAVTTKFIGLVVEGRELLMILNL